MGSSWGTPPCPHSGLPSSWFLSAALSFPGESVSQRGWQRGESGPLNSFRTGSESRTGGLREALASWRSPRAPPRESAGPTPDRKPPGAAARSPAPDPSGGAMGRRSSRHLPCSTGRTGSYGSRPDGSPTPSTGPGRAAPPPAAAGGSSVPAGSAFGPRLALLILNLGVGQFQGGGRPGEYNSAKRKVTREWSPKFEQRRRQTPPEHR